MIVIGRTLLKAVRWFILLCLTLYLAAAVYFCFDASSRVREVLSCLVFAGILLPLLFCQKRKQRYGLPAIVLGFTVGWYLSITPKMDANWSKDVAVLPHVGIHGDKLVVQNIRNFHYRSDTNFDTKYYDKTYDLEKLQSVDLFLSYWGTTAIAHTIMSFGFADGSYLPISIETRKEVGEEYSAVKGFFKLFELIYIVADERDVIGVRVKHRAEDVYLYRLKITPLQARKMLLHYVESIDRLERKPKFYNALTTNCTTSILPHIRAFGPLQLHWSLLANGYLDRWRYDQGIWGHEIPFEEFRKRSKVNEKVLQAYDDPNFSSLIREGLPSIDYFNRHKPASDENNSD